MTARVPLPQRKSVPAWVRRLRKRRGDEQQALLQRARAFADGLPGSIGVRTCIVFGSVARGDFNVWSDVDVLVVADGLPDRPHERIGLLLEGAPAGVQPVAWTPDEFARESARGNPIAREAVERGVVLVGRLPD